MEQAVLLKLEGEGAEETAAILAKRLGELGHDVLPEEEGLRMRARPEAALPQGSLRFTVDAHDAPAFAAEKILDELDAQGLVHLDDPMMDETEDAEMQERLRRLGYLD